MKVDVWSDISCPWCFVGTRRLQQAFDGQDVEVTFHPFMLRPDASAAGENVHEMLRTKYGREPAQMFAPVHDAAKITGIPLDLNQQPLMFNTAAAHTLLRHAKSKGTQVALADALFNAYFLQARNIADRNVLEELAVQHGFRVGEAASLLAAAEIELTRKQARDAGTKGIRGVPFFVFNGKLAVSGAQTVQVLKAAAEQARNAG